MRPIFTTFTEIFQQEMACVIIIITAPLAMAKGADVLYNYVHS